MLAMENPRLVGDMLTGNRSMFLSTDGSLAWLYHCPLMRSPPHVMNQCYDKIPIFYKNAIFFDDPNTRQTDPDAQVQKCSDQLRNLFQVDMEDENSWFTITLTLEHRKWPAVFGPKDVTPVSRRAFGGARNARIYTRVQLSQFWDNILIDAASRKALQNFSRELIVPNTAIHWPEQFFYYAPRTGCYVAPPITSKISLWTHLDQLPIFWNFVEFFSLASCLSSSSWSNCSDLTTHGN